jgi:hypothetical protein
MRGRSIYADAIRVIAWATLLLGATAALHGHTPQRGALVGAVAAVVVALSPAIAPAIGVRQAAGRFRMVR